VEAGGTAEWVDITSNIGAYYEEANDGVFIYKTQSEPFSNAEEYQNKPVGDYTLKVRVQTYKVVRDNTSREILSEEIAPDACEGLVEGHLMVQLVDEVITAIPATMDSAKFGGMSQRLLLELPRLNKVTCQQDHQNPMNFICQDPAGNPIKTYHDVSVLIFAADDVSRTTELARSLNSFVPADFDSTQRESQLMELNNSLAPGMYNVVFEEQKTFYTEDEAGNIIVDTVNVPAPQEPEFTEWTNTPQFAVGSVDADQVTFNPSTLNPLLDKDESGNLITDLVFEDESGHFSGSNKRYIRILKTVEGGSPVEKLTKTLIEDGVDGVIISENFASKTTTVQVTRDFTDEETWPEGEYRIELYLTDTATEPVCFGELKILKKPVNLVFYHHDHLGSTRMITDEDGGVVSTHDFAAYGEEIAGSDYTENRMKFTGHERDPETDLDYMMARYYSAGMGRFLQVDPGLDYDTFDPRSWNLYAYVRGNPIQYVDRFGLSIEEFKLLVQGTIDQVRPYFKKTRKDGYERAVNITKEGDNFTVDHNSMVKAKKKKPNSVRPLPGLTPGIYAWWHSHPAGYESLARYEPPAGMADVLLTALTGDTHGVRFSMAENMDFVFGIENTGSMELDQDMVDKLQAAAKIAIKMEGRLTTDRAKRIQKALLKVLKGEDHGSKFKGKIMIYVYDKKEKKFYVLFS